MALNKEDAANLAREMTKASMEAYREMGSGFKMPEMPKEPDPAYVTVCVGGDLLASAVLMRTPIPALPGAAPVGAFNSHEVETILKQALSALASKPYRHLVAEEEGEIALTFHWEPIRSESR